MNEGQTAQEPDHTARDGTRLSRRAALAATAGLTASISGCAGRLRDLFTQRNIGQLSLTITTLPADSDRGSIRITNELEQALTTVGVDVSFDVRSGIDFNRAVLYDHEFDICIGRHPGGTDPDFLYEALHSKYVDESGWQNPFGYANLAVDDLLEKQRHADGAKRRDAVTNALETIATKQPFVPICVPEEHRVVRTDRFTGWADGHPATRSGYLGLEPVTDGETLRAVHTDSRPTTNLNPLAADYRGRGTITQLLYDSLATDDATGEIQPWLAESWEWRGATLDVRLRSDCVFHDGEPVTAADVEFTYQFLADMSGNDDDRVTPTPRFRGQIDAVEAIDVRSRNRLELTVDAGQAVGERALLVPILPAHIWRERSESPMRLGGSTLSQGTTTAVTTNNIKPVGSGPYQFANRTEGNRLTLERFDDHFTLRPGVKRPAPTVDTFSIDISPNSETAIQAVENDTADITSTALDTNHVGSVDEGGGQQLLESPSWTVYFLGFNTRKAPFGYPRFRRVIAQLIDKEWLVENVFYGHARPTATPVVEQWTPDSLTWNGQDPETPFLGTDGEVNVPAARAAFEDAGFRYDERDRLLVRQ
ncbi:ABC transporter substrate-binding protein [Haloterrigena sp. H1]|uniref:ABC transporter substrate-binding protein n=1 Tax=Haloterrigena sp. H1 TaxID=2552943 RepID=UPI00110E5263|nr:ABC transporter substrate-binding protein [Haloterrigena sp. H1]TMT85987.1 ABC transporter substrate-binding protein [Haloterrigena sp. H1]